MATLECLGPEITPQPKLSLISRSYHLFKEREFLRNCYNLDNIQQAAEDLANGAVIVANMCGVQGFVIDGTNTDAIDKVFALKGRERSNTLVIGASSATRERLIDHGRLPDISYLGETSNYDLPHFFEYPIREELVPEGIGQMNEKMGRVGVVFWANFYLPLYSLEAALQARNHEAFLAGSSANLHGEPTLQTAKEAYWTFRGRSGWIGTILVDSKLERDRLFSKSHVMLGIDKDNKIKHYRGGSVTLRSFSPIYPDLIISDDWKDPEGAMDIDINILRAARSYLRNDLIRVQQ